MTPQRLHVEPLPDFPEGGDIVPTIFSEDVDVITAVLVGLILGDGHLTKPSLSQTSQLMLSYSNRYLEYLQWIHNLLMPIGLNPIQPKTGYEQHRFTSQSSKGIGRLRELFYPHGVKIVPNEINQLLIHPISLAIWYMDDGTLDYRVGYHFNISIATYNFSPEDCSRLSKALWQNFAIQANINQSTMRGKVYYRLYFPSESTKRFLALVEPYIQPCLTYKTLRGASSCGNT